MTSTISKHPLTIGAILFFSESLFYKTTTRSINSHSRKKWLYHKTATTALFHPKYSACFESVSKKSLCKVLQGCTPRSITGPPHMFPTTSYVQTRLGGVNHEDMRSSVSAQAERQTFRYCSYLILSMLEIDCCLLTLCHPRSHHVYMMRLINGLGNLITE